MIRRVVSEGNAKNLKFIFDNFSKSCALAVIHSGRHPDEGGDYRVPIWKPQFEDSFFCAPDAIVQ